ncbi:hypothetical protein BH09BAC3_BH09BAC3_27600 [soil metagenome]
MKKLYLANLFPAGKQIFVGIESPQLKVLPYRSLSLLERGQDVGLRYHRSNNQRRDRCQLDQNIH